jgi:hypothetical protein
MEIAFDDDRLVGHAGLVPVMRLAEDVGLAETVNAAVRLPGPVGANPGGKVAAVVAGMVAGADTIDGLDRLRHGGMGRLFDQVYAPSTLGSFLRLFTFGHCRQLQAASRQILAGLVRTVPLLLRDGEDLVFIDVDSLLRRVYGRQKQGVGFGHAKVGGYNVRVRGLSPLVATMCTRRAAPLVAATRLRAGQAASARGATSLVTEAIGTARQAGASGKILVRGDSAFYVGKLVSACRRAGVGVSVTAKTSPALRRAIATIDESRWVTIRYPNAIFDEEAGRWISEAEIAETTYTAFAGTRHAYTARLIVRRVPHHDPKQIPGQEVLTAAWRYHPVFTDNPAVLVQAEADHRHHAVVEQVFADLIDGPLAHLPSGGFAANGAWLACAGIAHNLLRAAGALTSFAHAKARAATLREQLITIPANVIGHARRTRLRMPTFWPWRQAYTVLWRNTHAPPTAA